MIRKVSGNPIPVFVLVCLFIGLGLDNAFVGFGILLIAVIFIYRKPLSIFIGRLTGKYF